MTHDKDSGETGSGAQKRAEPLATVEPANVWQKQVRESTTFPVLDFTT